jgi:hypothetical protein
MQLPLMTGWIEVQQNDKINFELEKYPLEIKTEIKRGHVGQISVGLYTASDVQAGGFTVDFTSYSINFDIFSCLLTPAGRTPNYHDNEDEVCRVKLAKKPGISLKINCEDEEILNFPISQSKCSTLGGFDTWNKEVAKIMFFSSNNYYRALKGK